jgi:hypothetical protein
MFGACGCSCGLRRSGRRHGTPSGNEVKSGTVGSSGRIRPTVALGVLGTSRVSRDVLLLFAAILAADGKLIGVGAGSVYQIDCVVIQDELCQPHV